MGLHAGHLAITESPNQVIWPSPKTLFLKAFEGFDCKINDSALGAALTAAQAQLWLLGLSESRTLTTTGSL